ncbi:MAG: 4'-phosphopantetheinyl transferase superfamily protein [Clostridia bacterium]|nr:4'-phosphopantetheinyl transferase superfamily protein [Clostridia bacterium]
MILFIHEGKVHAEQRDALLRRALFEYAFANGLEIDSEKAEIRETEKGKPYFENIPVRFSISHSGQMWICLMADFEVGADIQEETDVKAPDIAGRFFTENEADYINFLGADAFFDVWVRKEAYIKYTGNGLGEGLSSFSVIENGRLKSELNGTFFTGVDMGPGIRCALCTAKKEEYTLENLE